jgi:hypothetical protein
MVDQKECSVAKKGWRGQQQIGKLMKRSGALKGVSGLADPPTLVFLCQLVVSWWAQSIGSCKFFLIMYSTYGSGPNLGTPPQNTSKYSLIGLVVYIEACRSNKPGPMMAIYFTCFLASPNGFVHF